jgi:NDP-sugar pyrophosphorylase family protein/aminoglycoside/choline kinase family phosphotransferase
MMKMPRKALVLAAGLGTRLRPLTYVFPKPLMPLWNLPLLEHVLRLLESWGVQEIVVNAHWMPETIEAWVKERRGTATITLSFEPEILGTGGALRPLRAFFGQEPFWMMNADIAAALKPEPLLKAFAASGSFAAAWLEPKKGPRTVEMDYAGRITCWKSPTPGVERTFTFCGLQLLSPKIFDFLPASDFSSIVQAYQQAMEHNLFVHGATVTGSYWDDAGTVDAYRHIHAEVKKLARSKKCGGELYDAKTDRLPLKANTFFAVSSKASVPASVKGTDSIVLEGTTVVKGASLKGCVLAGGLLGGKQVNCIGVSAARVCDAPLLSALQAMGWAPEKVTAQFLGARGSDRSFWRLWNGTDSVIAIRYALTRAENARYSGHAALLAEAGVPVPAIRLDLPETQLLLLEDCGDDSLQQRMNQKRQTKDEQWYQSTVEALVRLHREGTRLVAERKIALEPAFDEALYAWEQRLFEEHLLKNRYGYEALPADVASELKQISQKLLKAKQVLLHRDFQSSNVLFKKEKPVLIDFQGMRLGAGAYDLASLLYDPYLKVSQALRKKMAAYYLKAFPENRDAVALLREGAVQRLVQALGAYGRLAHVGQKHFAQYILPALENLLEVADACELDALGGCVEELIAREKIRYEK